MNKLKKVRFGCGDETRMSNNEALNSIANSLKSRG